MLCCPVIRVSLPARINVVGSPTDACEGAYATLTAAVEVRGGAEIADAVTAPNRRSRSSSRRRSRRLCRYAPELPAAMATGRPAIRTWTDVPASSGLAGSSVLVLAVLAALRAFYALDPRRCNDYVLAEIAQRAEEHEMGIVCGFADRYVPLFGDLAYVSYHGKLWHAPLGEEPLVTYEKLGAYVPPLRFVVATTGVQRNSGAVHAPMRARYLEERRRGSGPLLALARQLGETAWRGKIALLAGDLASFGEQIDRNQALIDEMMAAADSPAAPARRCACWSPRRAPPAPSAPSSPAPAAVAPSSRCRHPEPPSASPTRCAPSRRARASRSEVFVVPVARDGLRVEG